MSSIKEQIGTLKGASLTPKCSDHKPELKEDGVCFEIFCHNCGFHAYGLLKGLFDE